MIARPFAICLAVATLVAPLGCTGWRQKPESAPEPTASAKAEKPKEESFLQQVSHKIMPGKTKEEDEPPTSNSPVKQIHTIWSNQLNTTRDTVNNGAPLTGVVGRLYLFGEEVGFPLNADGKVTVDLYDITGANLAKPKMLERWEIDRETLKRLGRKDTIGWGYTLFLPWSTYKPEITRVQLQARFVPDKGIPLFAPAAQVSVQGDQAEPASTERPAPLVRKGRESDSFIPPIE